jgi:phenylacetate-CoA ligase
MIFDSWTGYYLGMPKIVLWGSERDMLVGRETLKNRVGWWLRNEYYLNAFRMTDSNMVDYVKVINKVRPVQILAYVESIYQLSRIIDQEGLEVYPPQAIITSAETLYSYKREDIERVFRAPVFNRYGSREVGDIACECEAHHGLHVSPLTHYIEIIRDDGSPAAAGEVGEVVVTSLINYAMPLIRYRIGDMAIWAEADCPCGRKWPLLKEVTGRVTDTFITDTGTKVGGGYFEGLLYFKDWIKRYQFVQESYTLIRLIIVPAVPIGQARWIIEQERAEIEEKVCQVMGKDCSLKIEIVSEIPTSPTGKYRYTASKVIKHG